MQEQVVQISCGCPSTGSEDQAGWGFECPGLVKDVPDYGREAELDDL